MSGNCSTYGAYGRGIPIFVTEDTSLGRSIAADEDTEFVSHFALGQARLGNPLTMIAAAFRNMLQWLAIILRRRPDMVITTGAVSQLFIVFWARLIGARVLLIDSFARFDEPSAFARLAGPLAHRRFSQSAAASARWHGSVCHDPLLRLDTPGPPKSPLLFATVGATLSFDRLVNLVLEAKQAGVIDCEVILQVGVNNPLPEPVEGVQMVRELAFTEVQAILAKARFVVCHGGTGSIITALQNHCVTIVIPRLFELGEHYDNHQAEITAVFVDRGLVLSAHDTASFAAALDQAGQFTSVPVTTDYTALIADLEADIANSLCPMDIKTTSNL